MGEAKRKRLNNRFSKMSPDGGRPIMPDNYSAPLDNPIARVQSQDILIVTPAAPTIFEAEDRPYTKTRTPAAVWRENGELDPHGDHYDCERHETMGGQFTDDEIAFQCGMASGRDLESIAVLHRAKERIRWLSRKLVAAEKRVKELEGK